MARMIEIVPAPDDMYVFDLDELHDVAMGYIEAPGSIDVPAMIDSLVEAMFREEETNAIHRSGLDRQVPEQSEG